MDIKLDMKLVLIVLGIVLVVLIASYAKNYSENFTASNSPQIQDIVQNDVPPLKLQIKSILQKLTQ